MNLFSLRSIYKRLITDIKASSNTDLLEKFEQKQKSIEKNFLLRLAEIGGKSPETE